MTQQQLGEDGRYLPSHLSPSQLTLYTLCPILYRERYVLNLSPPPQPERQFGIAVHAGLEAQFRGQDDEATFLKAWREHVRTLDSARFPNLSGLRNRGLELLAGVRQLGLCGEPERRIVVTAAGLSIPIFGIADLWADGVVIDFKTAGYGWTQSKADSQLFQPAIYSHAYSLEHDGQMPRFEFVVLPRVPAPIQVFDASRSAGQVFTMFEKARAIHAKIEAQQFDCTCSGRYHMFDPDFEEAE